MPYPQLPSRALPYHLDGTVIHLMGQQSGDYELTQANLTELNDEDYTIVTSGVSLAGTPSFAVVFFTELKTVEGIFVVGRFAGVGWAVTAARVYGSPDSTNGRDGAWEQAQANQGMPATTMAYDSWRQNDPGTGTEGWKPISFSQAVKAIRIEFDGNYTTDGLYMLHVYCRKAALQTPDDLVWLDVANGDQEYIRPQDFGDRAAGSSQTHQVKLQNTSGTKTANNITITVNHADFLIGWDGNSWTNTLTIDSLGPAAKSNIIWIKNTTPAPPTTLGPKRTPLTAQAASWT